ncbi:aminoacyl-tRNA deacylase [Microbacterium sp. A93]|uniref:aminoacyl-tRNA deacylase n=1 Tax=Microbacterium sp. A93 TaxID=3450716 RepID=UPI003F42FFA4
MARRPTTRATVPLTTRPTARATTGTPALTALRRAGVAFEVREFEVQESAPEAAAGARPGVGPRAGYGLQAAAALGEDPGRVFKTLMVQLPDGSLAAGVVPVAGSLDLKSLAAALGVKKVAMADPALAERRTGYVVGGISPLGQRQRPPVVVDSSALALPDLLVSGGRRGLDLRLSATDLVRVLDAVVADIATS